MKKFLSLVMALIMVMSLVTVASAADYTDAADVDKTEAVDVMSAVGVFQGSAGKFNPKAILNRAEAAKLIAYLDLGEKTAEALPAVQSFSDVPATHWAAKYIAYCADAGYINGVGNGKFDPTGKLTGYQFGKLLLCVLGYDATIEAFTGANWSIAVAKLMKSNDINDGVKAAPSAELTREDAAQYCLNALKATTVDYESKGTNITINGVEIATGASKAEKVVDGAVKFSKIDNEKNSENKYFVELGEKLFDGKLELDDDGVYDDFGRKATTWTYDGDEVGTYGETADYTFTTEQSAGDIAKALKGVKDENGYKIENDTKVALYNKTAASQIASTTANGKVVMIYVDDGEIEYTSTVEFAVGEVTKVYTNTKTGDVSYYVDGGLMGTVKADDDDTIVLAGEVKKDDIVTYVSKVNGENYNGTAYLFPTTVKTGKVTKAVSQDYVILDGTKHPSSVNATAVSADEQKVWFDQFGVVCKTDNVSTDVEYVYVIGTWINETKGVKTYYVQYVTAEGEIVEAKLSSDGKTNVAANDNAFKAIKNAVATLDLDGSKIDDIDFITGSEADVVELTGSISEGAAKLAVANIVNGNKAYYFADDVTFVFMDKSGDDLKVTTSKTVEKMTFAEDGAYAVLDDGEVVTVFNRDKATASTKGNDLLFMADAEEQGKYINADDKSVPTYEFYLNGEKDLYGVNSNDESLKVGFWSYAVDKATGDLDLVYEDDDIFTVTVALNGENAYGIAKDTYVEVDVDNDHNDESVVLADDAVIYDTTSHNLTTLADIVNLVEDDVDVASLTLWVVYDSKAENITTIYVVE